MDLLRLKHICLNSFILKLQLSQLKMLISTEKEEDKVYSCKNTILIGVCCFMCLDVCLERKLTHRVALQGKAQVTGRGYLGC